MRRPATCPRTKQADDSKVKLHFIPSADQSYTYKFLASSIIVSKEDLHIEVGGSVSSILACNHIAVLERSYAVKIVFDSIGVPQVSYSKMFPRAPFQLCVDNREHGLTHTEEVAAKSQVIQRVLYGYGGSRASCSFLL